MELAIYGYGGHAREVAAQILQCTQYINITFFVDDEYANEFTKPISEFDWSIYYMIVKLDMMRFKNYPKKLNTIHLYTLRLCLWIKI